MTSNNGLKVCTFNAKCDDLDYKCCIKDNCYKGKNINEVPESLVAAMIAVTILPSGADIYNIQNVKNKCVVEHLLKEIARVKEIVEELNFSDVNSAPDRATVLDVACRLNAFSGLCEDGVIFKDLLASCDKYKLDYVNKYVKFDLNENSEDPFDDKIAEVMTEVYRYVDTVEYDAYHNGSCLTLVKKSLCLCPEVKTVSCVDSLVLFFEHCERKFINVNVNLGDLVHSFDDLGCKKDKVDSLICFLREFKDCGSVLMSGSFGDLDYDVRQLLYLGDAKIPEIAQRLTANGIGESPVPSDFPTDINDPLYEFMQFLIKNCNAEYIPYSWLLQYLRLKGCKKCCLYKLVSKDSSKCGSKCKSSDELVSNVLDCNKPNADLIMRNRSQMRNMKRQSDKMTSNGSHSHNKSNKSCDQPACVPGKQQCCAPVCTIKCSECKVKTEKGHCDDSKCEFICKKPYENNCKDNKFLVKVDTCKDLCEKKPCCDSCGNHGPCDGDVCPKPQPFEYCDTLTVLKKELCLYNSLDKVENVEDRFTGFHNHFNRCLDCKYPRGMFQAWAMCEEYERPCKPSRVIDNNSELLALDHFLVSDCLKNNIKCSSLSEMCIEKCGKSVKDIIALEKCKYNAVNKIPFCGFNSPTEDDKCSKNHVFEYGGSIVRSFFTHRMHCVVFDFPHLKQGCNVQCGETLHGLGLTGLWSAICTIGSHNVNISVFEKFGIDKHSYFRDYFWKSFSRKFNTKVDLTQSELPIKNLAIKFGDCEDEDPLFQVQKKSCISEEEFYKHLLCVFSNTDNRDRFIATISIMEALYRTEKCLLKRECENAEKLAILHDTCLVNDLFRFLSKCFGEKFKVANFFKNFINSGSSYYIGALLTSCGEINFGDPSEYTNQLLGDINFNKIGCLLTVISPTLRDNCLFMEILCRYASRALDIANDCNGDVKAHIMALLLTDESKIEELIEQILSILPVNDEDCLIKDLIRDLLHGADPKSIVLQIVEQLEDDAILVLLSMLNLSIKNVVELNI
jgi:hypothetical protein